MSLVKKQKVANSDSLALITSKEDDTSSLSRTLFSSAIVLEGHQGPVLGSKFSHNGNNIASVGMDRNILLWNLPTSREDDDLNYGKITGHKGAITSIRWTFDDSIVVTSSADKSIGFWDVETGKRIRRCQSHESTINELEISEDSTVLSVSDDGCSLLWDPREKYPVSKLKTDYPLLTCSINNQGSIFYIGGIDPTVKAYDFRLMTTPLWECLNQSDSITSIAINNDDSVLLTRSLSGAISTLSAKDYIPEGITRSNAYIYEGAPSGNEYQLIRACFSPDNTSIISGSEDTYLTAWDFNSRKILRKLGGHKGTVIDVDYHPSNKILLSTSTDGSVIVREI